LICAEKDYLLVHNKLLPIYMKLVLFILSISLLFIILSCDKKESVGSAPPCIII